MLHQPSDLAARGRMLLGAAYAGLAIENSMLGGAHAAANPLTAHFQVVHGVAVGLMLPAVIRFNSANPVTRARYAALAVAAGIAGSHLSETLALNALLERLIQILNQAAVPDSLKAAGVEEGQLEVLSAEAARQWTASFNPRPVTATDFLALYREAAQPR